MNAVAGLAVWQARLGHLLGLEKLAWNAILPEYDPFKYGSFAVNAGDVVYQLTAEIQKGITAMGAAGRLDKLPPILAFSSVVDATVSTQDLVNGLFERLPAVGHELVLFDINRMAEIEPLMRSDPAVPLQNLRQDHDRAFALTVVSNQIDTGPAVVARSQKPGDNAMTETPLGFSWPSDIFSLTHVALPFRPDDPLYGVRPPRRSPGIRLGKFALRGERGVLRVSPSDMLRLRWNPFHAYLETRLLNFLDLDRGFVEGNGL